MIFPASPNPFPEKSFIFPYRTVGCITTYGGRLNIYSLFGWAHLYFLLTSWYHIIISTVFTNVLFIWVRGLNIMETWRPLMCKSTYFLQITPHVLVNLPYSRSILPFFKFCLEGGEKVRRVPLSSCTNFLPWQLQIPGLNLVAHNRAQKAFSNRGRGKQYFFRVYLQIHGG